MTIQVASQVVEALRREAEADHPRECCGILLGERDRIDQVVPTQNVHPTPETHFEIEPQALIDAHRAAREGRLPVIGYYHSHPTGNPVPSSTDQAMASSDGRVWAIVAGAEVRFWEDRPGGFVELSYEIIDR